MAFHWWVWPAKESCRVSGTRSSFPEMAKWVCSGVRASEEAALLWLMRSFWVLPSDFGVSEAGWGLRDGIHHGEIPSTFIAHIKPTNTFFHFAAWVPSYFRYTLQTGRSTITSKRKRGGGEGRNSYLLIVLKIQRRDSAFSEKPGRWFLCLTEKFCTLR